MTTSAINYRPYVKNDVQNLLTLWENSSDFGAVSKEVFESWILKTPYENAEIIVAEHKDKELIGQMTFMPARMVVNGDVIKAMRIAAPVLNPNYRFAENTIHPIFEMFLKGIEHAKKLGFSLVYIFPARGWLRAIQMYPELAIKWQTATYDTFSVAIKESKNISEFNTTHLNFEIVKEFTKEYDQLWEKAILNLPVTCGIVRKKEWLTYRLGDHCIIEARDRIDNSLNGYLVIKKKSGLLVDMLATTKQDLKKLFWGSLKTLTLLHPGNSLIKTGKITGMYTEMMACILENKEVDLPNYKFDFGCCALDDSIDPDHIKPVKWYMMPDV